MALKHCMARKRANKGICGAMFTGGYRYGPPADMCPVHVLQRRSDMYHDLVIDGVTLYWDISRLSKIQNVTVEWRW